MTRVDQFESVFRSADKPPFHLEPPRVEKVLLVTDQDSGDARALGERVKQFLRVLGPDATWEVVAGDEFRSVDDLLARVEQHSPDLVCTHRNLHSMAWKHAYSLGDHVVVLSQSTATPVLLLPHPDLDDLPPHTLENTNAVMAITDHLTGDDRLVNHAVHFTEKNGRLLLTHVEDQATFDHYMNTISKIPSIDTEEAREEILAQLLKEPHDFVRSCRAVLEAAGLPIQIEEIVTLGHHLAEHRRLVEEHEVDLLVMNTKDDDQLAMHGLAYPLAVELRHTPILML